MDMIAVMSGSLLILLAFAVGFLVGRGAHERSFSPLSPRNRMSSKD